MTHDSLRVLLAGIVDYAGLFPPAGLDMRTAAANYAEYLAGADAWMLGRFVVPAARLDELARERDALATLAPASPAWRVSALAGSEVARDLERIDAVDAGRLVVDALELKLDRPPAIAAAAAALEGRVIDAFVEVPVGEDPGELIGAIARAGLKAKIRTGGVTADAFPAAADVVRFLRRCLDAGVAFKATAGLHHALHGNYRLTYAADAPCGAMFGFLNVFLAAAALRQGASDDDALATLECASPREFSFDDVGVRAGGLHLRTDDLCRTREGFAVAFGSCSFREPVDELRALGLVA